MTFHLAPLIGIAVVALGLVALIWKTAQVENEVVEEEGVEVAWFLLIDKKQAVSLTETLVQHGIAARLRPAPRDRRGYRGFAIYVDPQDEATAHEVLHKWDSSYGTPGSEGAV